MSLMTVTASHLPLSNGMVGRIQALCPDILVTTIAELGLRLSQKPFGVRVGPVAVDTRDLIHGMFTSLPFHKASGGMAFQTDCRSFVLGYRSEAYDTGWIFVLGVDTSRTVA